MRSAYFFALLFSLFSSKTALFSQTADWQKKVDAKLLAEAAYGRAVHFLVVFEEQADLSAARGLRSKAEKGRFVFEKLRSTAARSQAHLSQLFYEKRAFVNSFFIANLMAVEGDLSLIELAARQPEVARIERDPEMRLQFFESKNEVVERGGPEWGIQKIKADSVWAMGFRGQNVVVGGEDTGYDWTHPCLQTHYRGYQNATSSNHNFNWWDAIHQYSPLSSDTLNPCGLNLKSPCDDNSHGTHTMGTMIGDDGAGNQIGVAPEARWIGCRNMERGNGRPSTYIECFQFFLAPTDLAGQNADPLAAPHVINNSWYCSVSEGCDSTFDLHIMQNVIQNLQNAGIVVVISNGNFGSSCQTTTAPPALFENSFSIGATRQDDTIAGFSSRGGVVFDGKTYIKPNVSAPGQNVRSSVPNGGFANYSGTSMAGPHVVGAVALLISAEPSLAGQVDLIQHILEATAERKFSEQDCSGVSSSGFPNNVYGWGRIDVLAAVKMAHSLVNEEPSDGAVRFFPNPFHDDLTLELTNFDSDFTFEIFDAAGRRLALKSMKNDRSRLFEFNTEDLKIGIYFYRIAYQNAIFSGKLIKI